MSMSDKVGSDCKLWVDVGGGSFQEATLVKDVDLKLSRSEVDRTSRASGGWKSKKAGLGEWGLTTEMVYDPDDPVWEVLRAAFFNKTPISIKVLDGESATGNGVLGTVSVVDFGRGEPLDETVTTKLTLSGSTAPTWQ
jgi:predicted secreted protein